MQQDPLARVVLVTHPEEGAQAFAQRLVQERLAACVSLHAVSSVYRWKGRIEVSAERQLVLKTSLERLPALEGFLAEEHPYDVPECIVLAPEQLESKYAAWLHSSL